MAFQLTPKQVEANRLLGSRASNIMLRGGSRSGKTFLLVRAICHRALNAPESRHAIWRFRFNHAKASIWQDTLPKVMKLCFPTVPLDTNETDLVATFPNQSQLTLGGLDDKARVEKVLGQEYATLYFNESSQIPWASVETAMSRLAQNVELDPAIAQATGRTHLPLKAYFDCNPPSKLHWSYELFRAHLKPGTKEALADPGDYAEMLVNPADNRANLPEKYFGILANMSEAKRLRFERGEWASEVNGAFWSVEGIDGNRVAQAPGLQRIVVAVDPSGTKGDGGGDDIGIIVAGLGFDGRAYVLADRTCQLPPEGWGRRAVEAYREFQADLIIGERNFGGAMVQFVIQTADKRAPFKEVHASRGKSVRAEPISALYTQGLVSHVGSFPDLEDQMANMTAGGYVGEGSPDRCFVAGTMIATARGPRPIEAVVAGDFVWTRKGLRKVLASAMTSPGAAVISRKFTDGRVLIGTPNHPVILQGGEIKELGALVWDDMVSSIEDGPCLTSRTKSKRSLFSWASNLFDTQRAQARAPADISIPMQTASGSWAWGRCIARCGKLRTGRFLPAIKSTIAMVTGATTSFQTSPASPRSGMPQSMPQSTARPGAHGSMLFAPWRLSGMAAQPAAHGTLSTEGARGAAANRPLAFASSAEPLMAHSPIAKLIASALAPASRGITSGPGDTTRTEAAPFAAGRSTLRNQSRSGRVPVRVLGCSAEAGRRPVYNLTVEGENEYYANGILVHNCDALVWALTELMLGAEPFAWHVGS